MSENTPMYDLVNTNIKRAKEGDSEAAKKLIREFCASIENNRDCNGNPHTYAMGSEIHNHTRFNENLLDYLFECFNLLLSGKGDGGIRVTADIALNLSTKGKRGKKASKSTGETQLLRGLRAWAAYKIISEKKDMPVAQSRALLPELVQAFNKVIENERIETGQTISIHTVEKAYKVFVTGCKKASMELYHLKELS